MQAGIYEHNQKPGNYYLLIGVARDHYQKFSDRVVYVPLRVEAEWAGTARMSLRTIEDFANTFTWVGDTLPNTLHNGKHHD